jgi:phosphoglycolate phosphatase-like HAD superfamily hydrolase
MTPHTAQRILLIFDLDGTLYRTDSSFLRTMRRVYEEFPVPYPGDAAVLGMVGETFDAFLTWLIAQGFPDDRSTLSTLIGRYELDAIRQHGVLFDGVAETLRVLAARGCVITLCTNGDLRYASAVLDACGIRSLFARLQTLDEGRTKTSMIAELLVAYPRLRPIVVGDRRHDLEAARANGCLIVGAAYGYARDGELSSADVVIHSFPELPAVVERCLRSKPASG